MYSVSFTNFIRDVQFRIKFVVFSGTIGCIWFVLWVMIVREGPEKDKFISKDELRYIQSSLGTTKKPEIVYPWKDIFTSKAVYAISASHFAENWGFYTLLTQLPSFLKGKLLINRNLYLVKITICIFCSYRHSAFQVGKSWISVCRSVLSHGRFT